MKRPFYTIGIYIFLILMACVFIGPMIFTVLSSFKNNTEIFDAPFSLPTRFLFENYMVAWREAHMSTYFLNSIFISLGSVFILIIVATMASFALGRFRFKLNSFVGIFFLMGMMIPMHTVLVPVAYLIGALQLKNNLFALILLYVAFALPFSIFVLTGFIRGINHSLEESAIIDGAGYFQIYSRIILPLSVPAIATVSIFNFLSAWNNILFPLLFINDNRLKPISLGLVNFNGERGSDYGPLMAAIVITVLIPFIIYLLFQEKVESGLAAGAVKE